MAHRMRTLLPMCALTSTIIMSSSLAHACEEFRTSNQLPTQADWYQCHIVYQHCATVSEEIQQLCQPILGNVGPKSRFTDDKPTGEAPCKSMDDAKAYCEDLRDGENYVGLDYRSDINYTYFRFKKSFSPEVIGKTQTDNDTSYGFLIVRAVGDQTDWDNADEIVTMYPVTENYEGRGVVDDELPIGQQRAIGEPGAER